MIGRKIGQYQIVRKIGQGGMGVVFEARHESLELRAAVKVLRLLDDADDGQLGRFFDEARAVSAVQHPGLVRLFDFGRTPDGVVYMMMEFLDGTPLSSAVADSEGPGEQQRARALGLIRQVAAALAEVHKKGIVHRDLKPANILVVPDAEAEGGERAKVLDFGIARFVAATEGPTQTGAVMGTPRYMSPEQCEGASEIDDRSDVYSLGVVLFELLTGRHPYETAASSGQALMQAHLHLRPTPLRQLLPTAPRPLSALIAAMLDKEAGQRPPMAEVAAQLRQLIGRGDEAKSERLPAEQTQDDAVPAVLPAAQPQLRRSRLRIGFVVAAALLGCGLLGTGIFLFRHFSRVSSAPAAAPQGMLLIPGGSFDMGSTPDEVEGAFQRCTRVSTRCLRDVYERERGVRRVTLAPYYLHKSEVTNAEFADFLNRSLTPLRVDSERLVKDGKVLLLDLFPARGGIQYVGGRFAVRSGFERKPVVQVTWAGARAYCAAKGYDLPTEAQWEYAARGAGALPHDADWPWGDAPPSCGGGTWARASGMDCASLGSELSEVGTATQDRTRLGIFDLAGNVEEWTLDAFVSPYPDCGACSDPVVLPAVAGGGAVFRVTRGGSWSQGVFAGRAAGRSRWREDYVATGIGFRCAVTTKR